MTRRKVFSTLWFRALLAILVSVTTEVVFHQPEAHKLPIAVVASTSQISDGEIVARSAAGGGGPGIFFLVFPLMMAGAITAIALRRRPTWGIGRRAALVVGVGGVAAVAAWLAAVGLDILPGKPLLLAYAFLLTQLASAPSIIDAGGAAPRATGPRR